MIGSALQWSVISPIELSFVLLHSCRWEIAGHTETLHAKPFSVCVALGAWRGPVYQQRNVWEIPIRSWFLEGSRWQQKS